MASANTIATLLSLSVLAGAGYYLYQKVNGSSGTSRGGYTGKYDPKTGLGRGAPGFQTNVARVAVPAHIIARIRAGEEVSAEEITAAQEEEARRQEREAKGLKVKPRVDRISWWWWSEGEGEEEVREDWAGAASALLIMHEVDAGR